MVDSLKKYLDYFGQAYNLYPADNDPWWSPQLVNSCDFHNMMKGAHENIKVYRL